MPKIITSTIKRFPGSVTLPDYLTISQARAWEACIDAAQALRAQNISKSSVEYIAVWEPGINAVVQEWSLTGFSHDPIQTTPRAAVFDVVLLIMDAITEMYVGEANVPND
jgi:hypothetical protein